MQVSPETLHNSRGRARPFFHNGPVPVIYTCAAFLSFEVSKQGAQLPLASRLYTYIQHIVNSVQ